MVQKETFTHWLPYFYIIQFANNFCSLVIIRELEQANLTQEEFLFTKFAETIPDVMIVDVNE